MFICKHFKIQVVEKQQPIITYCSQGNWRSFQLFKIFFKYDKLNGSSLNRYYYYSVIDFVTQIKKYIDCVFISYDNLDSSLV